MDKKNGAGLPPVLLVSLGMLGALVVLVCLVTLDFRLFDLVYYVPGLGVSAALIFIGTGKHRARQKS